MKSRIGLLVALLTTTFVVTNNSAIALVYQGLTNTAVGAATASIACCVSNLGSGGQDGLIVSNLSSSGQDGVGIAMPGPASGLDVSWQNLDPSNALPVGAYVQSEMIGTPGGTVTNGAMGATRVTKMGTNNYVVSVSFAPIGASTYTVQAYLQGVFVAQATNHVGASLAVADSWPYSADTEDGIPICTGSLDWGKNQASVYLGSATVPVKCDQLFITPENVSFPSAPTAMQITASQVPVITITAENASLAYQGLTNTSLGAAAVSIACCVSNLGSSGQDGLTVSNLGSSGQDGVSIAMPGGLSAFDVHCLDWDPTNALPAGEYVQSQIIGTAGAVTNGVLATLTETKIGTANYQVTADFSPLGTSNCLVQASLGGVLVGQATTNVGDAIIVITKIDPDGTSWDIEFDDENCYQASTIDCMAATTMTLQGGSIVLADKVSITPLDTQCFKPTAFQLTASQVPVFTITSENESLVYQGVTNTSVGNATVVIACCVSNLGSGGQDGLTVSNLSSSGQDGVGIALNGAYSFDGNWLPLDPSNALPVGAYVQSQLIGTAGTVTNGLLGSTTVTKAGTSNYVMSADFSPIGASTRTVQVWNGSNLVAQVTGQSGPTVATFGIFPDSWHWWTYITPWNWPWDWDPCDGCDQPSSISITISGGPTVMGNKILTIPEGGVVGGSVFAGQILAASIPSITITDEHVSFVPRLAINSIASSGNNIVLNWTTDGLTNIVQVTTNTTGAYNPSNFVNLASLAITTTTTNYVDVGGATNKPTRYYRIREPLP
jgi:hypothetical protein